ncbi:DsbA family protein [Pseudoruegeria sp. SHC-113]|uniref:DsbA family oxidoreductase n=1 Tax=Pseudoruegeria sp. SHC-113 TaxID=2855439 RepID=UPI0021BB7819|nr:DsbA family oxidoreductase [Pseudoruegeria sp. SHC-113]MCT8160068.1 DsbA family oxidoreductase [Pseudoruegeria sp. SHC-113]
MANPIRVDIVSDVVCPWCIVGYSQLKRASEETGIPLEIQWHPFELNPQMPSEGQNLREHIMEKYGSSAADSQAARDRLTDLGADLGFTFAFTDDMRMVNTFRAHQLIHWADEHGKGHAAKQALFTAYFTERRDLNDPEVLADVAESLGLSREEALKMLESETLAQTVRQVEQFWLQQGISGVPAMVFERQNLVTGAQGEANYANILRHLAEAPAA